MQQTLPQMVIIDRAIIEDKVLRDRIYSTSNGSVERYKELSRQKPESGYTVKASVTVSATRVRNYLGVVTRGEGDFDGSVVGAEVRRRQAQARAEQNQRQARREILERAFRRWPLAAVNVNLVSIDIHPDRPELLVLKIQQTCKEDFIDSVEDTLRALSITECTENVPHKSYKSFLYASDTKVLCRYGDLSAQKKS